MLTELNEEARSQYDKKVELVGGMDPYCRLEAKAKSIQLQLNG